MSDTRTFRADTGKVEFYRDDAGEHRWRIVANNGNVLADCAEGYKNAVDAANGYRVMRKIVAGAMLTGTS